MVEPNIARKRRPHGSRGFSAMEIVVVIAIIGILSLVTIPSFINLQRRNTVRRGLRFFTSDLRSARQLAISKNTWVRMRFIDERHYSMFQSRDRGATWQPLTLGAVDSTSNVRALPPSLTVTSNTFNDSDNPADDRPDIDFRPDGTAGDFNGNVSTGGTVTLRTEWRDILNTVAVELRTTGQIISTESKS